MATLVEPRSIPSSFSVSPRCPSGYGYSNRRHSTSTTGPSRSSSPASVIRTERVKSEFHDVDLRSDLDGVHIKGLEAWDNLDNMAALGFTLNHEECSADSIVPFPSLPIDGYYNNTTKPPIIIVNGDDDDGGNDNDNDDNDKSNDEYPAVLQTQHNGPFRKWMKVLHRRAAKTTLHADRYHQMPWTYQETDEGISVPRRLHHRKSSTGSSLGLFATVRSASISVITRSRRNTARSRGCSRASSTRPRFSEDSTSFEQQVFTDFATTERSLQRRRVIEELISTEEGYIGDIRFLMNVYVTILASLPTLPMGLRSSINRNLTEIIGLHEEILGELHRAVPHSEYSQLRLPEPMMHPRRRGHNRWRSIDAVSENEDGLSWLQKVPGMLADPQVAGDVAKIFGRKMNRFFIYKEYGAKYEMMIRDVASTHRSMPQWETYQKGLEALAASLGSASTHIDSNRKSLTIGDLLVKPIQRICKYPLLLAELLKYTPVSDCPNSHMEVEGVLIRLREATSEINRATDDVRMKETLEKTWLLQDRLVFPDQRLDAASRNRVRSFGYIQLCGVLHVCWQTKESVDGQYMVCLLYKDMLCLAAASKVDQIYTIQASINLSTAKVQEVDNGRGLQCHTALYSWKLVFECDHQLHEIMMTACSPKEEAEWRQRLEQYIQAPVDNQEVEQYSSIALSIKSLGTVFGKPGTIARRISIHRATTVGPKSPLCQVALKNTCFVKETVAPSPGALSINRSQSLLTTSRIPVLAPLRGERARLEALLSDVWSREVLPFPGMTHRSRSEHLVRTSASSMMRKLSVASLTGSFSKRSGSMASVHHKTAATIEGVEHDMTECHLIEDDKEYPAIKMIENVGEKDEPEQVFLSNEEAEDVRAEISALTASTPTMTCGPLETNRPATAPQLGRNRSVTFRESSSNTIMTDAVHSSSIKASSPCSSEKENTYCAANSTTGSSLQRKPLGRSTSRWGRVGALRGEIMAQGIRNLFR